MIFRCFLQVYNLFSLLLTMSFTEQKYLIFFKVQFVFLLFSSFMEHTFGVMFKNSLLNFFLSFVQLKAPETFISESGALKSLTVILDLSTSFNSVNNCFICFEALLRGTYTFMIACLLGEFSFFIIL